MLKGKDIFMKEDLTKLNQEIYKSKRMKKGITMSIACTHDGLITMFNAHGRPIPCSKANVLSFARGTAEIEKKK